MELCSGQADFGWLFMLRQCIPPFARQPNGLRVVTHTKARGGLIAQLIDLHQRSQSRAHKEGGGTPPMTSAHAARRDGTCNSGKRLLPTLRDAVGREFTHILQPIISSGVLCY